MDYTIYILAGGKSSRMGMDKGLVNIRGKEMVQHCIHNLQSLKQEIILITSNIAYEKFGCRIISDTVKNQGPSQGIITALEDSQTNKNLIVCCDMPLINDLIIQRFDDLILDCDIVCYSNEFLYPFPGVYSKYILKKWKEKVTLGERSLQKLIPQFSYNSLPIEHPDLFLNVNTPENVKLVEEKLK